MLHPLCKINYEIDIMHYHHTAVISYTKYNDCVTNTIGCNFLETKSIYII